MRIADGRVGLPTDLSGAKVGVDNVSRRLAGHYGDRASLTLTTEPGRGTVAELVVPLAEMAEIDKDDRDAHAAAGRAGRR